MKILLLKNRINYGLEDDLAKYKAWLSGLGLEPEITIKEVDLPLAFKSFGIKNYWGLAEIKEQIRQEGIVPPCQYQIVCFMYDIPSTYWQDSADKSLACWTYPNDLNGSAFIEIGSKNWYDAGDWWFKLLKHESIHAMNRLLMFRSIYLADTIDSGGTEEDNTDRMKPYFKQMLKFSLTYRISKIKELITYLKAYLGNKTKRDMENMVRRVCREEKVPYDWENIIVATIKAESGLDPSAICVNKDGTRDLGIAQFNTHWYIEAGAITAIEALTNPEKSVMVMIEYFYRRKRMNDWLGYKLGAYLKFM